MRHVTTLLLASAALLAPVPALAQASELAAVQEKLAAMQAEIARLTAQVAELEARQATPAPVLATPAAVTPVATPAPAPASTPTSTIAWKGAPEITMDGGWSFKPRGRLQIDSGVVSAPDSIAGNSLGFATELRRAFLGVEGTLPGGFGYRAEVDVANSGVDITDLYLTYKASRELTLTVGQHKPFWGLDELTSDLFTPFMERAAFNSAFGFERRVGASGTYTSGDVILQLGAFADNAADLNADSNNSYSLDGRVVFAPEVGDGRLHLAGSVHSRDLNDAAATVRYRARPFLHTTDLRLVDTGSFSADGERSFGAELAYISGPFHVTFEGHQLNVRRPGALADPSFRGGYAEVGMVLTPGDVTAYRNGTYDRIRPTRPVGKGGIGAIQLNARYDYLDLIDGPIVGGTQQTAALSAIWIPTEYVRFLVNYAHLWMGDAAVLAGADRDYQVDTFGVRAQIDF